MMTPQPNSGSSSSNDDWYASTFPQPSTPTPNSELRKRNTNSRAVDAAVAAGKVGSVCGKSAAYVGVAGGRTVLRGLGAFFGFWLRLLMVREVQILLTLALLGAGGFGGWKYHQYRIDYSPGGPKNPMESCLKILQANPDAKSGIYSLEIPLGLFKGPFDAYCDMETDEGGWTLLLAYKRGPGEDEPLNLGVLPTSPDGYSHAFLTEPMEAKKYATEARFYCSSSNHNRVVHFKVKDVPIVRAALANKGYTCSTWAFSRNFAALEGHSGSLPESTDSCWNTILHHTFFRGGSRHWNVRFTTPKSTSDGVRWECDELATTDHATHHQVWVR